MQCYLCHHELSSEEQAVGLACFACCESTYGRDPSSPSPKRLTIPEIQERLIGMSKSPRLPVPPPFESKHISQARDALW